MEDRCEVSLGAGRYVSQPTGNWAFVLKLVPPPQDLDRTRDLQSATRRKG